MALATAITKRRQVAGIFMATFTVTPSGNYATGGEALAPTAEALHPLGKSPDFLQVEAPNGFLFTYDFANKKLMLFCNTAGGANGALGEHTAAAYSAGVTGVVHKGFAVWLS